MKVRVPSCDTCGHERVVEVDPNDLSDKIQRLEGELAALLKLQARVPDEEPEDSYRREQLRRLIKKTEDGLNESRAILEKL